MAETLVNGKVQASMFVANLTQLLVSLLQCLEQPYRMICAKQRLDPVDLSNIQNWGPLLTASTYLGQSFGEEETVRVDCDSTHPNPNIQTPKVSMLSGLLEANVSTKAFEKQNVKKSQSNFNLEQMELKRAAVKVALRD